MIEQITEQMDGILAGLGPVLDALARQAHAQGTLAPAVEIRDGTVYLVPNRAQTDAMAQMRAQYAAALAEEQDAYRREALASARYRAHLYTHRRKGNHLPR